MLVLTNTINVFQPTDEGPGARPRVRRWSRPHAVPSGKPCLFQAIGREVGICRIADAMVDLGLMDWAVQDASLGRDIRRLRLACRGYVTDLIKGRAAESAQAESARRARFPDHIVSIVHRKLALALEVAGVGPDQRAQVIALAVAG